MNRKEAVYQIPCQDCDSALHCRDWQVTREKDNKTGRMEWRCMHGMKDTGTVPPTGRGGNRGSLPQVPSVKGPPNSAGLVQIRSGMSVTFQSSFFKGLVSLCFQLNSACSFALCFILLIQTG